MQKPLPLTPSRKYANRIKLANIKYKAYIAYKIANLIFTPWSYKALETVMEDKSKSSIRAFVEGLQGALTAAMVCKVTSSTPTFDSQLKYSNNIEQ